MGSQKKKTDRKELRKYLEIVTVKFPNMGKATLTQVKEGQRVPGRINPRRNMPRHMVIKLTKIKDKETILKTTREKQQIMYKGSPIKLSADFSAKILWARREWQEIFSDEREEPTIKNTLPSKVIIQI